MIIIDGIVNHQSLLSSRRGGLIVSKYFTDHPSLLVPSSTVRFHGNDKNKSSSSSSDRQHGVHVIENEDVQFILEEKHLRGVARRTIQIKWVRSTSKGLHFLRALYTIVCVLFVGIFLAFCIQVTLNIVLDLAVISGETTLQQATTTTTMTTDEDADTEPQQHGSSSTSSA
jgi:hypothetical protein